MRSTAEVLAHHLKCFADRDIDGTLSDYSADALFFSAKGAVRGHGDLRAVFEKLTELGIAAFEGEMTRLCVGATTFVRRRFRKRHLSRGPCPSTMNSSCSSPCFPSVLLQHV